MKRDRRREVVRNWHLFLMAALAMPTVAAAQPERTGRVAEEESTGLSTPSAGVQRARGSWLGRRTGSQDETGQVEPPGDSEETEWSGPRVQLGYLHYVLTDGYEGGSVHAGSFGGYLPTGPLRLGVEGHAGTRDYALAETDLVLMATAMVGYQHTRLGPVAPYAGLVGAAGILLGKRFHTPVSHGLGGMGLEVGLDVPMVRTLHANVGFSYLRASMQGVGLDLYILKLRLGL
jgi:hypothetical protein